MSNPAKIGKREYAAALKQAREANNHIRNILKRLTREIGTSTLQALLNQAALSLMDNENALNRLEEIGRNSLKRNQE